MTPEALTLVLFAHEPRAIRSAMDAGIRDFMVDCEWRGKVDRQLGADTDTSHVPLESIADAASVAGAFVNCRINAFGSWTRDEIEASIEHGAQQIFLPLVRRIDEAERFVRWIDGRARPAILVETEDAVRVAADLASLPLAAVYVGLNDLAISRGRPFIFEALADGTVESLRATFAGAAFGFGGVTLLGCGTPVASELLLAEMHRLDCDFSFLRRSYYRDIAGKEAAPHIGSLRAFWQTLGRRDAGARAEDRRRLVQCIGAVLNEAARA